MGDVVLYEYRALYWHVAVSGERAGCLVVEMKGKERKEGRIRHKKEMDAAGDPSSYKRGREERERENWLHTHQRGQAIDY